MKEYMTSVVGNRALCRRLGEDVMAQRLSHAYILEGKEGSGKHTVAMLTAAAMVCERRDEQGVPLPCMSCLSCRKILRRLSPDLLVVGRDGRATLGVEAVRTLREDVHIRPSELEYKFYIIEDADTMTVQAQNALLLTLEEPPSYVCFFLLCQSAGELLETVRSRAPVLRLETLRTEQVDAYLCANDSRAETMRRANPAQYRQLLMVADGGIGRALALLEPKALAPILAQRQLVCDFLDAAVRRASAEQILPLMNRFATKRDAFAEELTLLLVATRDLLVYKKAENAPLCFFEDRETPAALCEMATTKLLLRLYHAVSEASEQLARNANVRLTQLSLLSEAAMI